MRIQLIGNLLWYLVHKSGLLHTVAGLRQEIMGWKPRRKSENRSGMRHILLRVTKFLSLCIFQWPAGNPETVVLQNACHDDASRESLGLTWPWDEPKTLSFRTILGWCVLYTPRSRSIINDKYRKASFDCFFVQIAPSCILRSSLSQFYVRCRIGTKAFRYICDLEWM